MNIQRSTDRILTTHVGSLPRPKDLLDLMKAKIDGVDHDPAAYESMKDRASMTQLLKT